MSDETQCDSRHEEQHRPIPADESTFDAEQARQGVRLLLDAMGVDPDCPELVDTWERRVPDVFETFSEGERTVDKPTLRTFETDASDLVVKTGIPLYSLCEHHLLPYHGSAHIAYRPDGEVVGLSKLPRYIRWQSRRLTMQEDLTRDIAEGLSDDIGATAVLIEITATHMCEAMRGIETETTTTTRATVGEPTDTELRRFAEAVRSAEDTP